MIYVYTFIAPLFTPSNVNGNDGLDGLGWEMDSN